METHKNKIPDLKNLVRLLDYSKYLYEQENKRNEKLSSSTNIYLVVITFTFTLLVGFLGFIPPKQRFMSLGLNDWVYISLSTCLGISVMLILLALIFTLLVVKVRPFESLCNIKEFIYEAEHYETEEELVGSMITHYAVATEKNIPLNNEKAKFLKLALLSFNIGFIILLFALTGFFILGR